MAVHTTVLALTSTLLVITSTTLQPAMARSHGHHQQQDLSKSDCVTLTLPADAVTQLLHDTSATRRHLQEATEVVASLEDLKTGQQQVKTVLLQELQTKVLEDLERSEVIQRLQDTQRQQTQMLEKMQTLLESLSEHGVQRPKPNSNELAIHHSTLSQTVQNDVITAAMEAVEKYSEYEDICPHIMASLEEHHEKYWECTVGRDYAAWVMANSGQFLKFSLGDLTFRIFRVLP